jgi:uncharacterized protein
VRFQNHAQTKVARACRPVLGAVLGAIEGPLAVAVSGGVDSVTLATFAHGAAGDRVEIFHAFSPAVPEEATERAQLAALVDGLDWSRLHARDIAAPEAAS